MTYRVVTRAYAGVANFKSGPFLTHPVIKLPIRARFTNNLNTYYVLSGSDIISNSRYILVYLHSNSCYM